MELRLDLGTASDGMEVIMIHSLDGTGKGRDQCGWMGVLHCESLDRCLYFCWKREHIPGGASQDGPSHWLRRRREDKQKGRITQRSVQCESATHTSELVRKCHDHIT
jgi:hypothetical protein